MEFREPQEILEKVYLLFSRSIHKLKIALLPIKMNEMNISCLLLGDFAGDKNYLESILEKLSVQTTLESKATKRVTDQTENALNYLIERRDFWSQQNPDYPDITNDFYENERKPSWKTSLKKTMRKRNHIPSQLELQNKHPYG